MLLSLIFGVCTLVISIHQAQAATNLTVTPARIPYTLAAGGLARGTLLLTNQGDDSVDVKISVSDAKPEAGTANIAYMPEAPASMTLSKWFSFPGGNTFSLLPGASKEISYVLSAPPDAEPGGHYGAVFFEATGKSQAGSQIKVGARIGVLALITVPGNSNETGKIVNFSVPRFLKQAPVPFGITFENTGNVHFDPDVDVTIKNIFGKTMGSVDGEVSTILPTGIKTLSATYAPQKVLFGYYTATVIVQNDNGDVIDTKSAGFFVLPTMYVGGTFLALALVGLIVWFIRKKVKISISLG